MLNNTIIPYSWDSLDKNILVKSASSINNFSSQNITNVIIENCQQYLLFSNMTPQKVSIEKHSLLDIEGAAIIARFKEYPKVQNTNVHNFAGIARLIQMENVHLPVVLLFPNLNSTTLEHECIHLCQWLNNQTYKLSLAERMIIFGQNPEVAIKSILKTKPEQALDLFIRYTCYKVWMELEAIYHTSINNKETLSSVIHRAQLSSLPFQVMLNGIHKWGLNIKNQNAGKLCYDEFYTFCNELLQINWIKDLVDTSSSPTLYEALYWENEDFEVMNIFGKIDDSELYGDDSDIEGFDI